MSLLDVSDLTVSFPTADGVVRAVRGVSFGLDAGRTLGIVGESGSGKSVAALTLLGLSRGAKVSGSAMFDGDDLLSMAEPELRAVRGARIAMVFQDPLSSLHPLYRVGWQIAETIRAHTDTGRRAAHERAVELLGMVGIPQPRRRVDDYPHQFSGGMRQRVMIAMALALHPQIVIADEPTTALDATVQAQVLDLLIRLQRELGTALVVITHDLGVVAEMADEILVMYGGKAVEHGRVDQVFYTPEMPYAWGLLTSMPRLDRVRKERLDPVPGNPPSLINVPSGCAFHPRCGYRSEVPDDDCRTVVPELLDAGGEHLVRCHIPPPRRRELYESDVKPRL
jgi:peptide/nickel transport system ATP-binding protein